GGHFSPRHIYHETRAREDAITVRLDDATVNSVAGPKVIRVNDQVLHNCASPPPLSTEHRVPSTEYRVSSTEYPWLTRHSPLATRHSPLATTVGPAPKP